VSEGLSQLGKRLISGVKIAEACVAGEQRRLSHGDKENMLGFEERCVADLEVGEGVAVSTQTDQRLTDVDSDQKLGAVTETDEGGERFLIRWEGALKLALESIKVRHGIDGVADSDDRSAALGLLSGALKELHCGVVFTSSLVNVTQLLIGA